MVRTSCNLGLVEIYLMPSIKMSENHHIFMVPYNHYANEEVRKTVFLLLKTLSQDLRHIDEVQ